MSTPGDESAAEDNAVDEPAGEKASFLDRVLRARQAPKSPWLLGIALVLFVGGFVIALRSLPPIEHGVRWWLLILVGLVLVPLTTLLNAFEYRLIARLAEQRPPMLEIFQVTLVASAANLLPVPGAVMVRLAHLRRAGVKVTRGVNLTAIVGIGWLGVSGILGGIVQFWSHRDFAFIAMVLGLVLLGIALVMLSRAVDKEVFLPAAIELVVIESTFIVAQAVRLYLIAASLRLDVSYIQAQTLVIATVAAAAIGFLPAGLGAREAIAAGLAPIVGLPAAVGLVITAVDRVVSLVVLALMSGVIAVLGRRKKSARAPDEEPAAST